MRVTPTTGLVSSTAKVNAYQEELFGISPVLIIYLIRVVSGPANSSSSGNLTFTASAEL